MERIPIPEDSGRDLTETLRLLERAHILGQVEEHGTYSIPLRTIVDTFSEEHLTEIRSVDTLINKVLLNFGLQPDAWESQLKPWPVYDTEQTPVEAASAAEYLYKGALQRVFYQTEDHAYGGASLIFVHDNQVRVELRASSQSQKLSVFENPQTEKLLYLPEDQKSVDSMRAEFEELPMLFEGVDAEVVFTAIFEKVRPGA